MRILNGGAPVTDGEVQVREGGLIVGKAPIVDGVAVFEGVPIEREFEVDVTFPGTGIVTVTRPGPATPDSISIAKIEFDVHRKARAEASAIGVLDAIAAAQEAVRSTASIDADADGEGEYGYLGELAGSVPHRASGAGAGSNATLDPAFVSPSLGSIVPVGEGGAAFLDGYYFQVHLPRRGPDGRAEGMAESANGGSAADRPDAELAERHFAVYAWPADEHLPPHRAFFVNEAGEILALHDHKYVGTRSVPHFAAALSSKVPNDMSQPVAGSGRAAGDGNVWRRTDR